MEHQFFATGMRGSTRQQIVFVTKLVLGANRSAALRLGDQRLRCLRLGQTNLLSVTSSATG
jgi:hypothetical protein